MKKGERKKKNYEKGLFKKNHQHDAGCGSVSDKRFGWGML